MLDYDREAAAHLSPRRGTQMRVKIPALGKRPAPARWPVQNRRRLGTKIEMNGGLHRAAPASISFVRTCRLRAIWQRPDSDRTSSARCPRSGRLPRSHVRPPHTRSWPSAPGYRPERAPAGRRGVPARGRLPGRRVVRSWIKRRSNCARAEKILNTNSPEAVVVSIAPSQSDRKPTPRCCSSSTNPTRWTIDRPRRSRRHTNNRSPACKNSKHFPKPGRSVFAPDALSTNSRAGVTPAVMQCVHLQSAGLARLCSLGHSPPARPASVPFCVVFH